jgi:hypothetical protein
VIPTVRGRIEILRMAERVRVPTKSAIAIGEIDRAKAGRWCAIGALLVPLRLRVALAWQPGDFLVETNVWRNCW